MIAIKSPVDIFTGDFMFTYIFYQRKIYSYKTYSPEDTPGDSLGDEEINVFLSISVKARYNFCKGAVYDANAGFRIDPCI